MKPFEPLVLMALKRPEHVREAQATLAKLKVRVAWVATPQDLLTKISDPSCICVFVTDDFTGDVFKLAQHVSRATEAYWVLISTKFSPTVKAKASAAGFSVLMLAPVSTDQIVLRVRQLWERFQKSERYQRIIEAEANTAPPQDLLVRKEPIVSPPEPIFQKREVLAADETTERLKLIVERDSKAIAPLAWKKEDWSLKLPDLAEAKDWSLTRLREGMSAHLKDISEILGARKVTFLSSRSDTKASGHRGPWLVPLTDSANSVSSDVMLREDFLPHMALSLAQGKPILFNEALPQWVDGEERQAWMVSPEGKREVASVAVPLMKDGVLLGAAWVQLGKTPEGKTEQLLAQLPSLLSQTFPLWTRLDFLQRFYRKALVWVRRNDRLPCDMPVTVAWKNGHDTAARVLDISEKGIFLAVSTLEGFGKGDILDMLLKFDDKRWGFWKGQVQVRWMRTRKRGQLAEGIGLRFMKMDESSRQRYLELFNALRLAQMLKGH